MNNSGKVYHTSKMEQFILGSGYTLKTIVNGSSREKCEMLWKTYLKFNIQVHNILLSSHQPFRNGTHLGIWVFTDTFYLFKLGSFPIINQLTFKQ